MRLLLGIRSSKGSLIPSLQNFQADEKRKKTNVLKEHKAFTRNSELKGIFNPKFAKLYRNRIVTQLITFIFDRHKIQRTKNENNDHSCNTFICNISCEEL